MQGEKWALEKVVDCFRREIDKLSTVTKQLPEVLQKRKSMRICARH